MDEGTKARREIQRSYFVLFVPSRFSRLQKITFISCIKEYFSVPLYLLCGGIWLLATTKKNAKKIILFFSYMLFAKFIPIKNINY